MKLLMLIALLAAPVPAAPAAKKKAPKPWEALLESSRAALAASKGQSAPAPPPVPAIARPPELTLPAALPELPPLPLPEARPSPAPAPAQPAPVIAPAIGQPDDAPDLVARPRRVIAPAVAPVPPPEPERAPLVAEPPPQPPTAAPDAVGSPELNFTLLDQPEQPAVQLVDPQLEVQLSHRRTLLTMHQTVGIGLIGLMAGTMVTGQLNYLDRFGGGADSARYQQAHAWLATTTLVTFGAAGLLAFFAPVPVARESEGIDRATLHKIGMIGATAGMVAEGLLGILTAHHEGLADQSGLARAHLAIGYSTLACMTVGVGALVF